jgi:hypothetical protein
MRVKINGRTYFRFPTGLILNRFTVGILRGKIEEEGVKINGKQALLIIKAVKRYKRKHGDWVIVEVESKDGDSVVVKV